MKKTLALVGLLLAAATAWADTNTTRLNITKPTIGTTGWGTKTNNNWDLVDSAVAGQAVSNVFTSSNTFASTTTVSGPFTVSSTSTFTGPATISSGTVTTLNSSTGTFSTALALPAVTASRALVTDSSSRVAASAVTATELGYVSGVTSAIQTQINALAVAPTGTVVMYTSSTAPSGYYQCDGSTKSRTTDATLFAIISTSYGVGDGSTTFNLPDFRGIFPKGAGTTTRAAGVDASGNAYAGTLGTYSQDKMQGHIHHVETTASSLGSVLAADRGSITGVKDLPSNGPQSDGTNGTPRTGHTTEPQSVGIYFIIKR